MFIDLEMVKAIGDFGAPTLVIYILVRDLILPMWKSQVGSRGQGNGAPDSVRTLRNGMTGLELLKGRLDAQKEELDKIDQQVTAMEKDIKELLSRVVRVEASLEFLHQWRRAGGT